MNEQADSRWVSGGYLIARPAAREGTFWDASLGPASFWTASDCLACIAPGTWALEWAQMEAADRITEAKRFGIPRDRVPEAISWVTSRFDQDIGWPNVFLTLDAAREFRARFVPSDSDAGILGLALDREDAEDFLQHSQPGKHEGVPGVYQRLSRRMSLEPGGQLLGSEVLGLDHAFFHSSLCNGLERDFAAKFNARPNTHGLYADHAVAMQCAAYVDRGEAGAEPALWLAWALTRYPP